MQNKIIVLEGLDASGKGTQSRMLAEKLAKDGRTFHSFDFPRYKKESSSAVKLYLSGALGTRPEDTNAYAASAFYAVDRYISFKTEWREFYENGDIILLDRYTSANALHQMSKMDKSLWEDFAKWLYDFEFSKLGIPKPAATLFLDMHPDIAIELMNKRTESTGRVQDIHEKDHSHLYKSYEAAQFACELLGWKRIVCFENGRPRSVEDIFNDIYDSVKTIVEG